MSDPTRLFASRSSADAVETGAALAPDFGEDGLLPAVTTDVATGEVLMLAYMDAEAFARTIETGTAHYYSRSRQRLWKKGESSGQTQTVREMRIDCDQDAVWLKVAQAGGGACHLGYTSCFYRRIVPAEPSGVRLEPAQSRVSAASDGPTAIKTGGA